MIKISLDKDRYLPGEQINVSLELVLAKPVRARGLFIYLFCIETKIQESTTYLTQDEQRWMKELGDHPHSEIKEVKTETESELFSQETKVSNEGIFENSTYEAVLTLPQKAPPTSYEFGHDNKIHVWKLKAKLDIPLAPDVGSEVEVLVSGLSV